MAFHLQCLVLILAVLAPACDLLDSHSTPHHERQDAPPNLQQAPQQPSLPASKAISLPPPPGWQGTGTLATRAGKLPQGAPAWASVTAEVLDRDGRRFLATSGLAARISNPALSRTTAQARARAELGRWTGLERLASTRIVEVWRDPNTGTTLARAEMELPPDWQPGQPAQLERSE